MKTFCRIMLVLLAFFMALFIYKGDYLYATVTFIYFLCMAGNYYSAVMRDRFKDELEKHAIKLVTEMGKRRSEFVDED